MKSPQTALATGLALMIFAPVSYTHLDVYKRQLADHKTGTAAHRRRPCAAASVGEEVGGSTSPPIFVCHSLPSVLKSGNEERDLSLIHI